MAEMTYLAELEKTLVSSISFHGLQTEMDPVLLDLVTGPAKVVRDDLTNLLDNPPTRYTVLSFFTAMDILTAPSTE